MGGTINFSGLGERSATVLQGIRDDITKGICPIGSMIPRQEELAERFSCTRPTVQKAIARLVEEGWLSTKRGAGTYVTRASAPDAHPSTAIAVMFTEDSHELSDLQKIIMETDHMLSVYQQTPFYWSPDRERQFLETVLHNRCLGLVAICTPKHPVNEDILEEIVGDITDEHDVAMPGVRKQPDGSVNVDGAVPIRDLNRVMGWELPDEEATTVAGLVIHEARSIPEVGQSFTFHGFRFRVLRRARNRITALRIQPLPRASGKK